MDIIFSYNENVKEDTAELYKYFKLDKYITEDIACYFTADPEVIKKRQAVYKNLSENRVVLEAFKKISSKMSELFFAFESAGIGISGGSNEIMLNSVCAVNSYISFIEFALKELKHTELRAEGLCDFYEFIKSQAESEDFKKLKKNSETVCQNIRNIKSVTVGINLDANLRVLESGLVSINSTAYRSANFIDKLLSASFNEPADFECICPLSEMGKALKRDELATVNFRLNKALDKILTKNIKSMSADTKGFLSRVCKELAGLKKGLSFYLSAVRFFESLQNTGLPVCLPKVTVDEYRVNELYNHRIASVKGIEETVPSSLEFDDRGKIYVLTGANSGGKTVFLESVITAQLLFQTGLPVFAREAVMCPFDALHVYLANTVNEDTNVYGRFENEVRWFSRCIETAGIKELFIMDELFSGTSSYEAVDIAVSALMKIKEKQGHALFSTHIHDTARRIEDNRGAMRYVGLDNLCIKAEGDTSLYTVLRQRPQSYESKAAVIAKKYGII